MPTMTALGIAMVTPAQITMMTTQRTVEATTLTVLLLLFSVVPVDEKVHQTADIRLNSTKWNKLQICILKDNKITGEGREQ